MSKERGKKIKLKSQIRQNSESVKLFKSMHHKSH